MKWKNAKEEQPDDNRLVFISDGEYYGVSRYEDNPLGKYWSNFSSVKEVLFWMEIPEFNEE